VGAGTYRAYEAFDGLIASGVPLDRFFVHLGHSRPTGASAKHRFYRYHPMLHSKVCLLDMGDDSACAFVGSHNLTGFALLGLNGEAGILIEGPSSSPEITAIRKHIDESVAQYLAAKGYMARGGQKPQSCRQRPWQRNDRPRQNAKLASMNSQLPPIIAFLQSFVTHGTLSILLCLARSCVNESPAGHVVCSDTRWC
jgi:phosphatidylserine/phosphatidylglycerophosphate/cardiolipin synthase-like enzyme